MLPEVDLLDQALFHEVSLVVSLLETNQTNFVLPNEEERRKTSENGADRNISLVGDDELKKLKQTRIPMKWALRLYNVTFSVYFLYALVNKFVVW